MNKIIKNIPKIVLGFIIMVSVNVVSSDLRQTDEARVNRLLSQVHNYLTNDGINDLILVYPQLDHRIAHSRNQVTQSYDKLRESTRVAEEFAKQWRVFDDIILPIKQILDRPENSNVVLDLLLEALVRQLADMLEPFREVHEFLLLRRKLYNIYTRIQTQSNQEISLALTELSEIATKCSETLYFFIVYDIELLHQSFNEYVEISEVLFRATTGRPPQYPYDASTYAGSSSGRSTPTNAGTSDSVAYSNGSTLPSPLTSSRNTLELSGTSSDMPTLTVEPLKPLKPLSVSLVSPRKRSVVPPPPLPKKDTPIQTPRTPPPATSTAGYRYSLPGHEPPLVPHTYPLP